MKYSERKELMGSLNPEQLNGGKTPKDLAEGYYRYYMLQLMADIADNVGSMAYAYGEMLKIQQAKSQPARTAQPGTAAFAAEVHAARTDTRSNANPTHRMEGIPPTEQSRYGGPK